MGVHMIAKLLPNLCEAAGIARTTNHSLRRTAISIMYELGMPESEIARRSRHKSVDALRDYYRSAIAQSHSSLLEHLCYAFGAMSFSC